MVDMFGLQLVKVESHANAMITQNQQMSSMCNFDDEQMLCNPNNSADSMKITFPFSTRKRGLSWSDIETRTLLQIWTERNNLVELDDPSNSTGQIYRAIADEMAEKGYQKTAAQCKTRMKTLKRAYKQCRIMIRNGGNIKKLCRFYKEMDRLMRNLNKKKQVREINPEHAKNDSDNTTVSNNTAKFDGFSVAHIGFKFLDNGSSSSDDDDDDDDDDTNEVEISDDNEDNAVFSENESEESQSKIQEKSPYTLASSIETQLGESRQQICQSVGESQWKSNIRNIIFDDKLNSQVNKNSSLENHNEHVQSSPINSEKPVAQRYLSIQTPEIFQTENKEKLDSCSNMVQSLVNKPNIKLENKSSCWFDNLPEATKEFPTNMLIRSRPNFSSKQEMFLQAQNDNRNDSLDVNKFQFLPRTKVIQIDNLTSDKLMQSSPTLFSCPDKPNFIQMNNDNFDTNIIEEDNGKKQVSSCACHFEQSFQSIANTFASTIEQIQNRYAEAEKFRIDIEIKKLEVERERQAIEREKIKAEAQHQREDREHQFCMLKLILGHVSAQHLANSDNTSLDCNTSQILNGLNKKI